MINVNDVVKFTPAAIHNVVPDSTLPTDPGLRSGALGAVACLRFTATGVFNYMCQPHPSMKGRVTVQ
jgi:plastocyanin